MNETQKVALVTGGTRGIGRAIVEQLLRDGFLVAATGTKASSPEIDSLLSLGAAYLQADIAQTDRNESLLDAIETRFGASPFLLVNNAGRAPKVRMDMLETTPESMQELLNTNLCGPFFLTQAAARRMAARKAGCIITVSSVSAYAPSINRAEYCISKAGLSMLTSLFAARMAEYGVPVYEIQPGVIQTDMTSKVQEKYDRLIAEGLFPIARWGTPQDVAQAVSLLASGLLPYSTGEVLHVDGGFHIQRL